MGKFVKSEDHNGVPVILAVDSDLDTSDMEQVSGVAVSVVPYTDNLPEQVIVPFLKAFGVIMPEDLLKPGIHDRVLAALRAAVNDKEVLRQLTDAIVRHTKEIYHGSE